MTLYFQSTLGQTSLETEKRNEIITVIQTDSLPGTYLKHLPIEGKFEQLTLFRNPNGTFDYVTMIKGEYQNGKRFGTWIYTRINQDLYWIDIEKEVRFYTDSTIITSDFGRIRYNQDSTALDASIKGMFSKANISCDSNMCVFQSMEKVHNRFCFQQEHLNAVITKLREGIPEIEIYYEIGEENTNNQLKKGHLFTDTLNSDYNLLIDSRSNLEFGKHCGLEGDIQPKGRQAIANLVFDKQYSLILSILDGNNDEGKVYAIEALLELNINGDIKLTEIEKQKIKKTIEADFEIHRCLGCESVTTYSLWLFKEDNFKKLLKLNNIEINYR